MHETRLAILAAMLFFLRSYPLETCSLITPTAPQEQQPPQQQYGRNQRPVTPASPTSPPSPTTPTARIIVSIANRELMQPDDFGSHLPQLGRFTLRHKQGRCVDLGDVARREGGEDAWAAAVAALAASGTVLAYQSRLPSSTKQGVTLEGGGLELENTDTIGQPRRLQQEQRQSWQEHRHDPNGSKMLEGRLRCRTPLTAAGENGIFARIRLNVSAGADALRRWTGGARSFGNNRQVRPRPPRRQRSAVDFKQGKPARSPHQRQPKPPHSFSFPIHQPSPRLMSRVQKDLFAAAAALSAWASSRSVAISEAVGEAVGKAFGSAARSASDSHVGIERWTHCRAHEISYLRAEAGRRAETALAAFTTFDLGRDVGGRLLDIRKRVRRKRAGADDDDNSRAEEGEYEGSRLALLLDRTVQNVVDVVARDGWEHVATTSGVVVYRQYIALGSDGVPLPTTPNYSRSSASEDRETPAGGGRGDRAGIVDGAEGGMVAKATAAAAEGVGGACQAPQFACVKATAILDVPPEVVYRLFADNSRVGEYNEHCREVLDLETLSLDCKITWAASGRMGPFKARDFCTLVHFRTLSDGTLAQVSRPVEHPAAPRSNRYVRSEILLAGNFMRAVPGDSSRTEFMMITHVNPGGAAETRAGAMLVNSLCTSSPVNFIRRLEVAAQKLMSELREEAEGGGGGGGGDEGGVLPRGPIKSEQEGEERQNEGTDGVPFSPIPPQSATPTEPGGKAAPRGGTEEAGEGEDWATAGAEGSGAMRRKDKEEERPEGSTERFLSDAAGGEDRSDSSSDEDSLSGGSL